MTDTYWAVVRYSKPLVVSPCITVRQMFDSEPMGGIGWTVLHTYDTNREAYDKAKDLKTLSPDDMLLYEAA